ncbi:MAG: hypothetical protein ABL930_04860 [Pseudobdellovibrio sp.]
MKFYSLSYFILVSLLIASALAHAECISLHSVTQKSNITKDSDLFKIYDSEVKISKNIQEKNISALENFLKEHASTSGALTKKQAEPILLSISNHPVVGDSAADKYNTNQEVGYCFGRAAYVHFELLKAGVLDKNITKIFAMGGLYRDNVGWDYHMATAFQDVNSDWWVIDNLTGNELLSIKDWMSQVSKWDGNRKDPRLRFYFTDAAKFLPIKGSYSLKRFNSPIYHGYFKDLLNRYSDKNNCIKSSKL